MVKFPQPIVCLVICLHCGTVTDTPVHRHIEQTPCNSWNAERWHGECERECAFVFMCRQERWWAAAAILPAAPTLSPHTHLPFIAQAWVEGTINNTSVCFVRHFTKTSLPTSDGDWYRVQFQPLARLFRGYHVYQDTDGGTSLSTQTNASQLRFIIDGNQEVQLWS